MTAEPAALVFGRGGNAEVFARDGWSAPEDGFTWAVGPRATLALPWPGEGAHALMLWLTPFVCAAHPLQTLEILAGGGPAGRVTLRERAVVAFPLPPCAQAPLTITFLQSDAARPCDFGRGDDARALGFAFDAAAIVADTAALFPEPVQLAQQPRLAREALATQTGLAPEALLAQFESVGDNCEFGLAQRAVGIEPLGLLRFVSIGAQDLVRGLRCGFAGLGAPGSFDIVPEPTGEGGGEWMGVDRLYRLRCHTFRPIGMPHEQVLADEFKRLFYLRRRLLEDLASARKILVVKRNPPLEAAEAFAILLAARTHGGNALLCVMQAGAGQAPGSVVALSPHFFCGYVGRFAPAPDIAAHLDLDDWLALCANTWLLRRALTGTQDDR